MNKLEEWEQALGQAVDTGYSYGLVGRMEEYKTNPMLGYRTAGSGAEWKTGEMLYREMEALGPSGVCRDKIQVDNWELERAVMRFTDRNGREHRFQLGAYQIQPCTEGSQEFATIYLERGTARSYEGVDVKGKLMLIDINQRGEQWTNFPVYQAYLKGAATPIAVQERGYGKTHDTALNAQDIVEPREAAAFSISQADVDIIKGFTEDREVKVFFDARSAVKLGQKDYNILGCIPGTEPDEKILPTTHYDSYFSGFQDDNAAVAMMLGIARNLKQTGYKPRKTLVFCAMTVEEWDVPNFKCDRSTGVYEQVFTARPQWQGQVTANLNLEPPAHAHGVKDGVRRTCEYGDFMENFLQGIKVGRSAYPEGVEVLCPAQIWSDDSSMAIGGVPSMVNDFSVGEFMETHHHSQYDNESFYQEPVYRFHHELYGNLVLVLDMTAVVSLDFKRLSWAARNSVDQTMCARTGMDVGPLLEALRQGAGVAGELYRKIMELNEQEWPVGAWRELSKRLFDAFYRKQDCFVHLSWHDDALLPQQFVENNLRSVYWALECLDHGNVRGALEAVYDTDNNHYALLFDEEVFRYSTEYVLDQPPDWLKWGMGRTVHHESLLELVRGLEEKLRVSGADVKREYAMLEQVLDNQMLCYKDDVKYMILSAGRLTQMPGSCAEMIRDINKRKCI